MFRELNEFEYLSFTAGQPFNTAVMLRIKGSISIELLENTLKKLQKRHPLLRVRIIFDDDRPCFTSEGVGTIPVKVIPRETHSQALKEFNKQLSTPFDLCRKDLPLIRVVVLSSEDISELIICALHTISDGLSMTFLSKDLIDYMGNPNKPIIPLNQPAREDDLFPPKVRKLLPKTAFFSYLFYALFRIYYFFRYTLIGKKETPKINIKESEMGVYSWKLTSKQTKQILSRCKKENISVHSFLCTIFLPEFPIIGTTVNVRKWLKPSLDQAFGFFSSAIVFRKKYRKSLGFWENAKRYQKKLLRNLRDRKVFFPLRLVSKHASFNFLRKLVTYYVEIATNKQLFSVNNLGSLDKYLENVDLNQFPTIESFYGGLSCFLNSLIALVFTLQEKMHFNFLYTKTNHSLQDMIDLATTIKKRLLKTLKI
ncbi:MAG: hypothetical protein GF308_10915 [Candidatus Heimdallarchaeota archaeon]|nr:hypothetical protein [Candidatus Heimdallarchaeota archaeon]